MRVILLTSWFFEYTVELSNSLSRADGLSVTLVLPKDTINKYLGEKWESLITPETDIGLFSYGSFRNIKTILIAPLVIYNLVKYIYGIKPDVVHIQESGNILFIFALPFLKKYPIVSTNHDVMPHQGFESGAKNKIRELKRRIAIKYTDTTIVHGDYLKRLAVSRYHINGGSIFVVPHGEFSIFNKFCYDNQDTFEEPNTILFFGRIEEYKGLDYLIKAEPIISNIIPEFRIIIAGYTNNFIMYENIMENKERFECHIKYIPKEDVPILFQRASIIVLPYVHASQSGIIPIAFAFKKPVVVTNVGSLTEVVDNGVNGYIVPPRDVDALAEAIIKLLKDNKLRKTMGESAYLRTKQDLSWERIANKTIEVYNEAINRKKQI